MDTAAFPELSMRVTMLRVRTRTTGFVNTAWDTLRLLFRGIPND